jgi:hypothetical protein
MEGNDVKRSKMILNVVGVCVLLLLAVNYMAGELSPMNTAFDTALAECRAKGWQDNTLAQTGSQISTSFLGSTAAVVLKTKDQNQPKTVRVQLHRWINLLGWEVVGYEEEQTALQAK